MRRILVDHFRRKVSLKRGEGAPVLPLIMAANVASASPTDWLELDAALCELEARDRRAGKVVELRYFAGLSVEETASALGVSGRTVKREWRCARAFLQRQLREGGGPRA